MTTTPRKASRLELAGVGLLLLGGGVVAFYGTSPSVSGEVTVGRRTMQAEQCTGFVGGVQIFLHGEHETITAGTREDGSLRLTYGGEDVTSCTPDSVFEFSEGTQGRARRPVIGGHMHFDCTLRDERLQGSFDFARCRQD